MKKNTNKSAFGFQRLVMSLQEHKCSFNFRSGFFTQRSLIYIHLSMSECYKNIACLLGYK